MGRRLVHNIGCQRPDPPSEVSVYVLVVSFAGAGLETEAAIQHVVDKAAASERAIVHVSWAIMQLQQRQFAEFIKSRSTLKTTMNDRDSSIATIRRWRA